MQREFPRSIQTCKKDTKDILVTKTYLDRVRTHRLFTVAVWTFGNSFKQRTVRHLRGAGQQTARITCQSCVAKLLYTAYEQLGMTPTLKGFTSRVLCMLPHRPSDSAVPCYVHAAPKVAGAAAQVRGHGGLPAGVCPADCHLMYTRMRDVHAST